MNILPEIRKDSLETPKLDKATIAKKRKISYNYNIKTKKQMFKNDNVKIGVKEFERAEISITMFCNEIAK